MEENFYIATYPSVLVSTFWDNLIFPVYHVNEMKFCVEFCHNFCLHVETCIHPYPLVEFIPNGEVSVASCFKFNCFYIAIGVQQSCCMVVQRQLVLVQVGGWVVGSRHTTELGICVQRKPLLLHVRV